MKERWFVVRSQEGVKEHAHQINFPAKPQKTQCCIIQGNSADSPPPPSDTAASERSGCVYE